MSQSNKSAQMKDEGGNAALIPGSSAWGALKGGTSQKPLILSSDGSALTNEKTSPKPSVDKNWPPSCSAVHINGIVSRWNSNSSTNGAWTDNKDIVSGWGSPNSSPIPNAGTEVWSAQKQSVEVASSRWGSNNAAGSAWPGSEVKNSVDADSKGVWAAQPCCQASVWGTGGDARPPSILSAASTQWVGREQCNNWGDTSPQTTSVMTLASTMSTWAQAAGRGLATSAAVGKSSNSAPGSNMSREELIVRAINSQDGWGQTPIRQDTAWDVTAEPLVTNVVACKISPPTESSGLQTSNTGTAIWETSKDGPPVLSSELSPHALLASSGKDSLMAKLPWAETSIGAGWDIPLQVEGGALLAGERSLPAMKSGTNSSAWRILLEGKEVGMSAVNPWNITANSGETGSSQQTASVAAADGGVAASQCSALTALLDKYELQAPSAAVWNSSALQPDGSGDVSTVNTSPTWGGHSVPAAGPGLVGTDQRNDIWSQAAAAKSAQWGSSKPLDNTIWSSASLVSRTFVASFVFV